VRATLVLAGTNTYTGVTVVAAGTLALNGTQPGAVTVAAAAVLSGTGIVQGAVAAGGGSTVQPGHLGVAGALTVGGAVFADGAQVSVLAGGTSALLRVTGVDGLTVPAGAGQLLVNVLSTSLVAGTYTVVDYAGTLQGGAITNIALQTYPPRAVMYLTNNTANTSIDLVVVSMASDAIRWLGVVNGIWNINTSSNWMTIAGAQTTAYLQAGSIGDAVVFDDAAVGNFNLTLATNVAPASITASNDLNDYTIAGSFGIGGAGNLTKSGAARLTLATSNTYAGGTLVLGGTLQAGTGGVFCAVGSGFITNHANLVFHHGDAATQAVAIGGTGSLIKEGAGTLTLAAFNTYTNMTTVNGGTLELAANAGSAGTLSGPLTINTGAVVVTKVVNALGYLGTPWVRTINLNDGTLATAIAGADNGWGLTINMNGGSITSLVPLAYFSMGATPVVNTAATDHPAVIAADLTVRDHITFNVARGSAPADLLINGNLRFASVNMGIIKSGVGVLVLSGTNTYSGGTQIKGGVLSADLVADGVGNLSRIGVAGGSTNYLALQDGTLRYTGTGTNTTTRFLWIDQPQAGSAVEVSPDQWRAGAGARGRQ
jgi:fibronectin-binding autotransporter adhesin